MTTTTLTKEQLIQFGKDLSNSKNFNLLRTALESFKEEDAVNNDYFQICSISIEDLQASNWDDIELIEEYGWDEYNDIKDLCNDDSENYLLAEEADALIERIKDKRRASFVVLLCNGVYITSIEEDWDEEDRVLGKILYYSVVDVKAVYPNGEVIGECCAENASYECAEWCEVANGIANHNLSESSVYSAFMDALWKDKDSELAKKIEEIDVYDYQATIEYRQPKLEYDATGTYDQPDLYPRKTPGLVTYHTDEGDTHDISCSATLVIIPESEEEEQKDDKSVLEKEEQECEDESKELMLKAEKGLKEGLLSLMSEKDQKILSDIREGKWKDFDGEYKWEASVNGIDMEVWEEQRSEWIIDSCGQSGGEPLATLWSELVSHCNDDEAEDQDELRDLKEELLAHIDYVMGYRCGDDNNKLSVLQRNAAWSYGGCRSTDFRNWREELMNQFLEEQSFAGFDEIDEILNELWDEQHKEIHNKLELMNIAFHQELLKEAWKMDEYEGHHVADDDFNDANEVANKLIDQITIFLMNREYNNEEEYEAPDMDKLKAIREKYCDPNSEPELIADDPASSEYDVIQHMMDNRRKVLEYNYDEGYYNAPVVDGVKRPCYAQACFDIATTEDHKKGGKQCGFTLTYDKKHRPVIKWDDEDDQNESTKVELAGKTVVISGDFKDITGLSQSEVKEALKKAGAIVGSSVTKKTDLLIQGEGIGSKNEKAKELGIPIVEWSTLALA